MDGCKKIFYDVLQKHFGVLFEPRSSGAEGEVILGEILMWRVTQIWTDM